MLDERYLTPKETSKMLGVSTSLLQKWRSSGVGVPYIKFGESASSMVRYSLSDIKQYVENNSIKTM